MADPVPCETNSKHQKIRLRLLICGAVQGVGFRPFIYRLAADSGLAGWVGNCPQGVIIEVEGEPSVLDRFPSRIETEKPPGCFIQSMETVQLEPISYSGFEIRRSQAEGTTTALVMPDIATCPECLREIFDPANRRYLYPFTNCTHCGPRFSIIESLPYDRAGTSMKGFAMCRQCQEEYDNPLDRRFHAQPNACPDCGPHLELWNGSGACEASGHAALPGAVLALRNGLIVAVKGLGGFHLMAVADNDDVLQRLRQRKHRNEKAFAVMFPSLNQVAGVCCLGELEKQLLKSPESPIVLLPRAQSGPEFARVSKWVAPDNPNLGAMLPYTPLHHMLLRELGCPVVATSGNLSEEPICIDEREAVNRLAGVADLFLVHNRPILRQMDDSVVRVMCGRGMMLRRARGYAPLPVAIQTGGPSILAVGAHFKNNVALSIGADAFISQHIGDLETDEGMSAFLRVARDLKSLYKGAPALVAADLHPDYLSTRFAEASGLPVVRVQHHLAHALSCMADNDIAPPVLGICWDGAGLGADGTIWGGEFLRVQKDDWVRAGYFRPFRLPGGDKAAREPHRAALGLLYEVFGEDLFLRSHLHPLRSLSPSETTVLKRMLTGSTNSPLTSSVGRLFDGVAALMGIGRKSTFEGQFAMTLEFLAQKQATDESYSFAIVPTTGGGSFEVDWRPAIKEIVDDVASHRPMELISARFHNLLAEIVLTMAQRIGESKVALSGGCFQNACLVGKCIRRLRDAGFCPFWHQRIPPNDGGIALGQIVAARRSKL